MVLPAVPADAALTDEGGEKLAKQQIAIFFPAAPAAPSLGGSVWDWVPWQERGDCLSVWYVFLILHGDPPFLWLSYQILLGTTL